ncbi:F0F1 ATP synthase subunit A [Alkalibacter rhizosphaerae]|uniref:ATP synthase subunit a n=1 Tax=Alkalibacter rhizosphaerae TaxID=2815577 RepID=A0A974XGZ5_9FIRM|nr:F0F1 ATP synthase subunit A [Alkalibacter rhizosphaerae]QSX08535.1 F0F1 ATP synthase subunit A [Alkalibacter rhizosphaerae]
MSIDPSSIVYFEWGFIRITATLVFAWVTMAILAILGFVLTRNLTSEDKIGKGQIVLEAVFATILDQIKSVSHQDAHKYFPFVSTLFLFIMSATLLSLIPGYNPPTGSLNTTIALALCVFFAVPYFGIQSQGIKNYLKQYTKPSVVMLPFNIISEFSRVISLAVRLYGNVMSSSIIVLILLGVVPFFFPVIIQMLGLLTGAIQAYIFAILAIVYIASATNTN